VGSFGRQTLIEPKARDWRRGDPAAGVLPRDAEGTRALGYGKRGAVRSLSPEAGSSAPRLPMKPPLATSIDVRDYYRVEAVAGYITAEEWLGFLPRLAENAKRILSLLGRFETRAIFFVLGWVGEQEPQPIRNIVGVGRRPEENCFVPSKDLLDNWQARGPLPEHHTQQHLSARKECMCHVP